ncbi:carboxylesterase/lipase family protein [Amycolatopsis nigrescens]|uniref:carboxylesterase/lipase family protein n=1 Tax=Amycolatopsis nigrescens TaxID=381445 RepID=UPI0003701193|nr:carboxylesterase family protein [Amycolatopsis nigrescens]
MVEMKSKYRRWGRALVTVLAAALAGIAGSGITPVSAVAGDGAVVRTDSGPVRGTDAAGYRSFQGIPFAAPPVGELRWRSPRPPEPWSRVRDATKPGNRCAQGPSISPPSTEEDCLYLNVTTPAGKGRPKPVMVWLHGGGLSYGAGSEFDAHRLAAGGDVVVVTINYRLGLFGFLGYPGLAGSGGFGLEDQQAALRWVQRNAAAFGGDAGNVTLFGHSGGAIAVCGQLTSPSARGLFHRAIMQSGSCALDWPENGITNGIPAGSAWLPLAEVQENGAALAAAKGCPDPATAVDCLRRLPVADLLPDPRSVVLTSPAFGNGILPADPERALAEGRFNRVPVMSGSTRDEQRLQAAFLPQPFSEEQYQRLLGTVFGDQAARIAAEYPSGSLGSPALAWAAVSTDRVWSCNQLVDDKRLARWTPTYGYEFADRQAPTFFPFPTDLPSGAYHSSELGYLFDQAGPPLTFTPEQQYLAGQLIRYWSRFAATGDPNDQGLPHWPRMRGSNVQSLAPGAIRSADLSAVHRCDFWSTVR